ncbi:hypothetical protein D7030_11615 [Flavobacteriaceae bacterium AU392]|nr:hypothetical protein D1817_13055 [Flavobacteriaceae bacterium]RKM82801.1 hypothetical protein D7030_11615 [Flavobacteriaceae bacterium AU392]
MVRIYFDKQIFSHLFKQEKSQYVKLLEKIRIQKASLFCYSHAHLLDLKNDKTDIKYSELKFIDSIVNDNYLSYHAIEKKTSCYLARPLEAFADVENETDHIDFSSLFDFDTSNLNPEELEKIQAAKTLLTETKLDFNFPGLENMDSELSDPLKNIIPVGEEPMSIMQWGEKFLGMVNNMKEDKTIYKGLRNLTDKHINNGKFTIEYDEIDFNEDLKDSQLQKTFTEYVNSNLNPNGDKEISKYDFFNNAYFTLDILGISKEPSKSVRFNNMLNDGIHSYYGAYCDCVVSDDQGFLKKTRALYKLLGIDTKVMHVDDFIKSFDFIVEKEEKDQIAFSKLLINDLKNGLVIDSYKSLDRNRETETIKPVHHYLGFFNRIDKIHEDGRNYLYFYRITKNYSKFTFIREYELVVNNAIEIFGTDMYFKEKFEWEKEKDLIQSGNWQGRTWEFDSYTLKIECNKGSGDLSILISIN